MARFKRPRPVTEASEDVPLSEEKRRSKKREEQREDEPGEVVRDEPEHEQED